MDSKNIYIIGMAKLRSVEWEKLDGAESEYRYIGAGDDFEMEVARFVLESYFTYDKTVYLIIDRRKSREVIKEEALDDIKESTKNSGVIVACKDFKKFFHVNSVGSFRLGSYKMGESS